jgi:serine/threonine-protein kinase
VALKVLHEELAHHADVRERFLRESTIANRIGHPGAIRVLDTGADDAQDLVFLVLELLEGETLESRRARLGGQLSVVEAVEWTARLLDVLAAAHDRGVVHRDVKPGNVFLTLRGELKVLDFGLARLLDGTRATRSGQRMGTPAFMSPEQAGGRVRHMDARSDLWSAGALLFTLLTGQHVHPGRTSMELETYAATQAARPIASAASWLPREIARVVDRALAFEPEDRWQRARDMQSMLLGALQ